MTVVMLRYLSGPVEAMPVYEKQAEGNQQQNSSIRMLKVCHFKHGQFRAMSDRVREAHAPISGLILDQHGGRVQHQIGLIPPGAGALKCFYLNLFSNRNQLNGNFE